MVNSETWSIYFEFDKGEEELYAESFNRKSNQTARGRRLFGCGHKEDFEGYRLSKLTFDKYMIQFIASRYADFDRDGAF